MSKIVVKRQEYANNGTHADEIKSVVKSDIITQSNQSNTETVPSSALLIKALGVMDNGISYISDCNECNYRLAWADASTLNTPYKQVGSGTSQAVILTFKTSNNNYKCQYAFCNGGLNGYCIYIRTSGNSTTYGSWNGLI